MAKLSRRKLIAGAAATPLAGAAGAPPPPKADPIVAKVRAWLAGRAEHDALAREWARLETKLMAKTRAKMNMTQARRSGAPEARAMRVLDKRIVAAWKKLNRAAGRIVVMRPTSAEGALAKIELGLAIQGPYDWEDFAYALLQDGFEQLRDRL